MSYDQYVILHIEQVSLDPSYLQGAVVCQGDQSRNDDFFVTMI